MDHPHHAGLWFNYGDVNGFDFWNNSDAIKPEDRHKMGSIVQTKIVSTKSGADRGELVVESMWVTGENKQILAETTRYVFARKAHARIIDEVVTLKALDRAVFHDDKEGVLGLRVAGWLESPDEKGGEFTDASGKPTKVQAGGSPGASGVYLTSEGVKGGAAWGTRGRWCSLTRPHRRAYGDDCDSRSSGEPGLSDLLACARIWAVRGQSAGEEYLRSQAAGVQLYSGKRSDGDVSLSRDADFARGERGGIEPRSGCVCG